MTPSEIPHERAGLDFIKIRLPDREPYRARTKLTFTDSCGGLNEVDLLVVTPARLVLVELKGWPGRIEGDAGQWAWTLPTAGSWQGPLQRRSHDESGRRRAGPAGVIADAALPDTADVPSTFSWMDLRDDDAQRVREALSAFDDRGMIDPLGFGQVGDAFSEMLFPGTSTLHTRARYFVLIPWVYQRLDEGSTQPKNAPWRARDLEVGLIEALLRGSPSHEGIIGRQARGATQQLASGAYWGPLQRWGIRRYNGSRQQ